MKRVLFYNALLFALFAPSSSPLLAQEQPASSAQPSDSGPRPPAHGEKLHVEGIHNAGKVNEVLYRGGQPKSEEALAELKKLGVTTIIDLRGEGRGRIEWERKEAEKLGMRAVQIPVSGWSPPKDDQVAQFLSLFHADPPQRIFVHCLFGDDRTGVFVATYRMAIEKWTPEEAMKEMYYFGFNGFWHPAMKAYIRNFPERLKSSPSLMSLQTQPATP